MEQDTHPFYRGPEDVQNTSQKTLPHCETGRSPYKLQKDTEQSLVIPCILKVSEMLRRRILCPFTALISGNAVLIGAESTGKSYPPLI